MVLKLIVSRGCLACCSKSSPIIAVDEPSKGLRIQGRSVTGAKRGRGSLSEDLWSTSTYEMDNSAHQSQRSMSSLSAAVDHTASSSNLNSNTAVFVNHGLLLWNQTRQQWLANKKPQPPHPSSHHPKEPKLSWSATYESLLGTNKPFPQPIPLSEMVDFLVDVWEQEGMYD
ncbi:zinc finger protein [Rhynchospora pubera]|uniref:Zinc finger protein n=2 Tax=Rhynchospora pubera TaxID=906938 RepID=A0AAV8FCA0_9POAL|nr:zinc finger protein [Rhynchospora pubera]